MLLSETDFDFNELKLDSKIQLIKKRQQLLHGVAQRFALAAGGRDETKLQEQDSLRVWIKVQKSGRIPPVGCTLC